MTSGNVATLAVDALEAARLPYMVVGSLSSNVYGIPRSTKDADIVVEFGGLSLADLMRHLGAGFELEPQMSFETITGTYRHRIRYKDSSFMIEFFLLINDPHP